MSGLRHALQVCKCGGLCKAWDYTRANILIKQLVEQETVDGPVLQTSGLSLSSANVFHTHSSTRHVTEMSCDPMELS